MLPVGEHTELCVLSGREDIASKGYGELSNHSSSQYRFFPERLTAVFSPPPPSLGAKKRKSWVGLYRSHKLHHGNTTTTAISTWTISMVRSLCLSPNIAAVFTTWMGEHIYLSKHHQQAGLQSRDRIEARMNVYYPKHLASWISTFCRRLGCVLLILLCIVSLCMLWILRPVLWSYTFPPNYDKPFQGRYILNDKANPPALIGEVPLLFHQIFLNYTAMPKRWPGFIRSCKSHAKNFTYVLWDRSKIERFLQEDFPWFLDTYRSYPYDVQRADAARYFIMYAFGGLYMDMDISCQEPMESIVQKMSTMQPVPECLFGAADPAGVLGIDFVVCRPRTEITRLALSHLPIFNRYYGLPYLTVMLGTGPLFVTTVHMMHPDADVATISLDDRDQYLGYSVGRTWQKWDGAVINWLYYSRNVRNIRATTWLIATMPVLAGLLCVAMRNYIFRVLYSLLLTLYIKVCQRTCTTCITGITRCVLRCCRTPRNDPPLGVR